MTPPAGLVLFEQAHAPARFSHADIPLLCAAKNAEPKIGSGANVFMHPQSLGTPDLKTETKYPDSRSGSLCFLIRTLPSHASAQWMTYVRAELPRFGTA